MTMNTSRASLMRSLRDHANRFDAESNARKRDALDRLAKRPLVADAALADYHDALLFIGAHPPDANTLKRVEAEFKRLSVLLKGERGRHTAALADRGLPWVDTNDLYVRVKPTSTTTDSRSVSPCSCSLICCASSTPCPS